MGSLIRTWWRHTFSCSLRFTSGATPADLLVASMAAKPSLPHTCKALVGFETRSYHAAAHSVRSGRQVVPHLWGLSAPSLKSWIRHWNWLVELTKFLPLCVKLFCESIVTSLWIWIRYLVHKQSFVTETVVPISMYFVCISRPPTFHTHTRRSALLVLVLVLVERVAGIKHPESCDLRHLRDKQTQAHPHHTPLRYMEYITCAGIQYSAVNVRISIG